MVEMEGGITYEALLDLLRQTEENWTGEPAKSYQAKLPRPGEKYASGPHRFMSDGRPFNPRSWAHFMEEFGGMDRDSPRPITVGIYADTPIRCAIRARLGVLHEKI